MLNTEISTFALHKIREYVHRTAGIVIGADKTALVTGRLWRRLEVTGHTTYESYFAYVSSAAGEEERQIMLDLLTTNETYFFREPAHFNFLRDQVIARRGSQKLRVWCAASSSGEEAYSIAMVLSDILGNSAWDILATDISRKVLEQARKGVYRAERINHIPHDYLQRFCRRGIGNNEGMLAVIPSLRSNITFEQHNLLHAHHKHEQFDVIFLRNVLIYFDQYTKQKVLENILKAMRPGGWLILGHCESLQGVGVDIDVVRPSIYRKPVVAENLLKCAAG